MVESLWRKGILVLVHCWWECRLVQPLQKTVWIFLKKLKMKPPHDSMTLLLGTYPKKVKTLIQKNTCPLRSLQSYLHSQDLEAAQAPFSRWVAQKAVVRLHSGILFSCKMKETLPFVTVWMNLESIMLSETASQTTTNALWIHLCVESKEQYKQNRNGLIDTANRLTAVRGRGVGGWVK